MSWGLLRALVVTELRRAIRLGDLEAARFLIHLVDLTE